MYLHEFGEEAVRPSPRQGSSSSFAPTGGRVSRAYGRDIRQPYPYENGMKFMENSDWEDPESGPPSLFLSGKVQHLAFSRNHKSAGLKRNLPSYSSGLKQAPGYGGGTNPAKSESGVQLGPSPSTDKHVNLSSRQAPQKHYSNETRLKVCGLTDPWGGVAAERQKSAESYLRSGNIKNNSCINSTKLHFPYNRASSSTSTFTAPLLPHINKSKSLLLSAIPASKPKYNHTPSTTVSSVNFRKENAASAPPLTASVGSPRKPAWGLSFQSPVVKGTDSNTRVLLAPKTTRKFRKVVAMSPTSTFIPPLASEKAQLVKIMTNEVVSTLPSRQLSENISAQMGAGEVSIVKNNCSRAPCMLGGETINESGVVSNDLTPVSHNKTSENAHVVCKGSNTSNSNGQPETLKVTNDNCSTKHNYSVGKTIDPSFNENNSNDFSNCDINFELDAFQAPQEINDLLSDGLDVGLLIQQQLDQHRHRQHRSEYPPPENQAGGWPVMDNNAQALQYPFNLPPFSGNPSALSFNHSCCFRAPKEGVRSGGSYRKSDVNFPALINDDDLSVACCG
ncbi:hypothetical protein Zmor_004160 [Zophobas morio]|jgi:hypothetical protein|uniref:Uncharacterized protein n=1 Tax=Zophobas morio TaxID=2755281 RepID=A0AA38HIS1_9CUCU|nr:hypothetical protein Zmor_004160 [Zophobas morio]